MWYEYIHVTDFSILGIQMQVWGLLLAIGVLAGWFMFDYNILKKGIKFDSSWLVFGTVISGILGARILQVIVDYKYYMQNIWEVFYVWEGGLASYGAIIFIFLFLWLYVKWYWLENKNVFWDAASISMMLSLFLARVGCFLINDHFGKLTTVPWAIIGLGELRHPISLYYALNALLIFVVLFILYQRNRWQGRLVGLMMVLYGVNRTLLDLFFKDFMGDNGRWWLTIMFGVILVIIGLIIIGFRKKENAN